MSSGRTCGSCRFCAADERATDYRRKPMWFCRKKTVFFSRNFRPGEGGRVLPEQAACDEYEETEMIAVNDQPKETVWDETKL